MALDAKSQEEPAKEDDLAAMPEGEDLSVTVNSNEEITAEDLIVGDDEGDFEEVKEDDYAFGKHWKNTYYHRHPDPKWNSVKIGTIKLKNSSDIWVVKGGLCKALIDDGLQYCRIYTLIDTDGDLLFAPYRVARDGETLDQWNTSAHQMFAEEWTTDTWFKIMSQRKGQRYKPKRAEHQDAWPKPEWPEGDFMTMLIESVRERFINSKDHDVYRAIKGQKAK